MTAIALLLVVGSALLHATWNLLAKRAAGSVGFVWLFSVVILALYVPVALAYVALARPDFTPTHLAFALGSGVLHVGYFVSLQRGYRVGDLSLVYPLARGSGPALATLLAIVLLGERPGAQALIGTLLIVTSVLVLGGRRGGSDAARRAAVGYGLLTGVFIASYTVWDGYAVGHLGASPLLFLVVAEASRTLLFTPAALRRRSELRDTWRVYRREIIGVAVLSPLAYVLVLSALQHAPISLVAPTREISILFATILGSRLLAEGEGLRRALAAIAMVVGVALLALS
ncbi:EamA family transporter [soil metagenome]|nr:EamA family transporter [Trueperaceae bacterium]